MMSPQVEGSMAPVPTAEVTESMVAPVTTARGETPRCAAASAVMSPRGAPMGTSGGSLCGSSPDIASSSSLYSVTPHVRLSTESIGNIVFCVAVTRPVRRAASASIGSTKAAAAAYTSGSSLRMNAMWPMSSFPLGAMPCRSSQRARCSGCLLAVLCRLPRPSIHMMVLPTGVPSAATGTVDVYWLVTATRVMSPAVQPASAVACRAQRPSALHHRCGSCSTPPSAVKTSGITSPALLRTRPVSSTTATLMPVEPRSTAITCRAIRRAALLR